MKIGLLAVALLLGAGIILQEARRPPERREMVALRDTLRVLRAAADSCRDALERDAARFAAFDERLDSLRDRVTGLEAMDGRGVPADSYATYLEAFDRYNDSVAGWTRRADTLRAREARCREITELHNVRADSLRRALVRQLEEGRQE